MNFIKRTDDHLEINIGGFIVFCLKRLPILIIVGVLAGVGVYFASHTLLTPQYEASIKMYVNNVRTENLALVQGVSQGDLNASAQLVETYSVIATSDTVLDAVIEKGKFKKLDTETLRSKISCESVSKSGVFVLNVTDPDPKKAAKIANLMADIVPDIITSIIEGSSAKVIDKAKVPTEISSPHYFKLAAFGFAGGFGLCFIFLLSVVLSETKIKSEKDLEQWEYPILGVIPDFSKNIRIPKKTTEVKTPN